MAATGELQGDYNWHVTLNGQALGQGTVTPQTVGDATTLRADIEQLLLDQTNGLVIGRTASGSQTGDGPDVLHGAPEDLPAGAGHRAGESRASR